MASANTRASKRTVLRAYVRETRPNVIGEREWQEIRARLAPVSESYLRKLVRETGLPLAPLVEGVRQDSFAALERTLVALQREYSAAVEAAERQRAKAIRRAVIGAKDHARFALAKLDAARRAEKEEMILWIMTWLENPGVFPVWLELRKRASQ